MAHLRITRQHPGYWAIHLDGIVAGPRPTAVSA